MLGNVNYKNNVNTKQNVEAFLSYWQLIKYLFLDQVEFWVRYSEYGLLAALNLSMTFLFVRLPIIKMSSQLIIIFRSNFHLNLYKGLNGL
jgi:hypothetical protein